MKDRESNIDELFHRRLYHTEVPPPEMVWGQIETALQQKRRRKWLLGVFLCTCAVVGAIGFMWNRTYAEQSQAVSAIEPQEIGRSAPTQSRQNPTWVPTSETGMASVASTQTVDATAPNKAQTTSNETYPRPSGALDPKGVGHRQTNNWRVNPLPLPSQKKNTLEDIAPIRAVDPGISSTSAAPLAKVEAQPDTAQATVGNEDTDLDLAHLPLTNYDYLSKSAKRPTAKMFRIVRKKKEQKKCFDFEGNSTAWFVDAYVGPSLAFKSLTATPDNTSYLQKRQSSEKRDWASFHLGVRGTYVFKRHFLMRAGLHYDHSTEVFEQLTPGKWQYVIDFDPVTGKLDTVGASQGTYRTRTFNRLGMLDIPIMVGGEIRFGNMGLSANAGVSFNMLFWKRGQVIDSNTDQPAWFTPKRNQLDVFRERTGMSIMGSVQYSWHLHPNMRLYLEPYYRQVLDPVSLGSHPVEQRHRVFGLSFGATRIF
jgi:cytoskeletal protein RodZ